MKKTFGSSTIIAICALVALFLVLAVLQLYVGGVMGSPVLDLVPANTNTEPLEKRLDLIVAEVRRAHEAQAEDIKGLRAEVLSLRGAGGPGSVPAPAAVPIAASTGSATKSAPELKEMADKMSPAASQIEAKAEQQYWYQRGEKNEQIHPGFYRYGANWPCMWGEELTGTLSASGEGNKWTCGVRLLKKPCTIYSFGSRNDIGFEQGMHELGLGCAVHIYDPTVGAPAQAKDLGFHYRSIGLGTHDGQEHLKNGAGLLPVMKLSSLMQRNGHQHIDVLKVDIDYSEHNVLEHFAQVGWPSVGQLLLEVHIEGKPEFDGWSLDNIFTRVEKANFRLFHHEVNWEFGASCCIEYSFIQMNWRPNERSYSMKPATSFKYVELNTYPQHKHLVDKYLSGRERSR